MKKLKRMLALLLTAAVCLTMGGFTSARTGPAASGGVTVSALYTEAQTDPIGLDQVPPELSWTLRSDGMNQKQTAYRVLAASSAESLEAGTGDVWDSGRVESETPFGVSFGGTLTSRQKVFWKVMVWDAAGSASAWSETATFEMGLLEESDWEASWIGRGSDSNIITSSFAPVTARYVRMKVVRVGPNPLAEGWNRLQFMEWEIYSGGSKENLARGKKVTATDEVSTDGAWAARNLTNGAYTNGWHGYSTNPFSPDGRDIADRPVYVTMDLGERTTFDTFRLYGRTDAPSNQGDVCPNYPEIYDIEVSDDGRDWATHTTVTVADPPRIVTALPLFAKDFTVDKSEVASARLYVSGLGLYEARLNGQNVADTLFDPGETDFDESVQYVTYDVTDKLIDGGNAVGIMLGNGVYNIGNTPGRYQKVGLDRAAEIKTIAQLEVTMRDGSVQRVVTDGSWDQTQGPVTFSSWHGGEDYDARAEIPGWDAAGTDRSAWGKAGEVNPPAGALRARNTTPIRVTGEVTPVSVKQLANGHYLVDMGVNFAGIYTLRLPGMRAADAGKTVKIWPSETLKADGTVDQTSTGAPIFDTYTIGGGGDESFHIRFCYHGFRYLEIENMPFALKPAHITGQIVRTDNERIGRLSTSSDLINGVERIVDRAIESNMYSTLTDCPAREKLGWLEVSQLMYESMAYSYDIRSWMSKTSRDMAEAQTEAGQVPGVAPASWCPGIPIRSTDRIA